MTRRFALLALLVMLSSTTALSQNQAVSYQALTISTTAVALAEATINPVDVGPVRLCVGRLETADVRYRLSGTPTASEGLLLRVDDVVQIQGQTNIRAFQAIRAGASDGVLRMECYR